MTIMQKTKKQTYESPQMTEIHVELESSICSGSVDFVGEGKAEGVTIAQQDVVDLNSNNDFSGSEWIVTTPSN